MNDALRQYYLTQLGIDVYKLKISTSTLKKSIKFMIVVHESFSKKEDELFNAIINSIHIIKSDICVTTLSELKEQVSNNMPQYLIILGELCAQKILKTTELLELLRGKWHESGDIPVRVSYHPAYLLQNPSDKARAYKDWVEIKQVQ